MLCCPPQRIRLQTGSRRDMAHEESPIRVNNPVPVPNRCKGNRYAGRCCAKHGCEFVEIEGNRKAAENYLNANVLPLPKLTTTVLTPQSLSLLRCIAFSTIYVGRTLALVLPFSISKECAAVSTSSVCIWPTLDKRAEVGRPARTTNRHDPD